MDSPKIYRSNWIELPGVRMPPGRLMAAIGDLHGMIAQARVLASALEGEFADQGGGLCVWLGDYIDRGPDSASCLDLAAAGVKGAENVCLLGNHEVLMLDCLDHPGGPSLRESAAVWVSNGGGATLESLGLPAKTAKGKDLPERLAAALGPRRAEFLRSLCLSRREGDLLFAHAGVDPTLALDRQPDDALIWIRDPFLHARQMPEGVVVVHGHSIAEPGARSGGQMWRPGMGRPSRIGVDGGCYRGGTLTAALLQDGRVRFVHAVGEPL